MKCSSYNKVRQVSRKYNFFLHSKKERNSVNFNAKKNREKKQFLYLSLIHGSLADANANNILYSALSAAWRAIFSYTQK